MQAGLVWDLHTSSLKVGFKLEVWKMAGLQMEVIICFLHSPVLAREVWIEFYYGHFVLTK